MLLYNGERKKQKERNDGNEKKKISSGEIRRLLQALQTAVFHGRPDVYGDHGMRADLSHDHEEGHQSVRPPAHDAGNDDRGRCCFCGLPDPRGSLVLGDLSRPHAGRGYSERYAEGPVPASDDPAVRLFRRTQERGADLQGGQRPSERHGTGAPRTGEPDPDDGVAGRRLRDPLPRHWACSCPTKRSSGW